MATWTVIDEHAAHAVESGDELRLDPALLGWTRRPEGLCRDDVCVPVPGEVPDGVIDAATLARMLQRPLAIDPDERVAAFAATPGERSAALRTGIAPDFELPDVNGVLHRLSQHRGRKVVVYAWGSW